MPARERRPRPSPFICCLQKRDIKVAFSADKAGKGQGLVVRERGAVVAAALNP